MLRKDLAKFAEAMELTLLEHDDAKGETGWLDDNCTVKYLFESLDLERDKMEEAIQDCNVAKLHDACVDAANFCMMISSRLQKI